MKKLLFLLLFFPLALSAQILDEPAPVEEDIRPESVRFRESIPQRLKTGKPQAYRYNNLWGYILNDSVLIPCKYEHLDNQYSDLMICREPKKLYGAINKKGETVIPFEYFVLNKEPDGLLLAAKKDVGYGLLQPDGSAVLVPLGYSRAMRKDSVYIFYSAGRQRIVKHLGGGTLSLLMEGSFDEIDPMITDDLPLFAVKQQDFWGLMDYNKKQQVPCVYDKIQRIENRMVTVRKENKKGIVDMEGRELIPCAYDEIYPRLRNGLIRVANKPAAATLMGLLDSTGRQILPLEYGYIEQFYRIDLMKVRKGDKWGIADVNGTILVSPKFAEISAWKHSEWVEKKPGQWITEETYGQYFVYKDVANGSSIGLWHLEKGKILPPEFDYFEIMHPGSLVVVTKGEKRALYGLDGRQITGFEYDALSTMRPEGEYLIAYQNGNRTLISARSGKQIQPEYYDDWFFNYLDEMQGYFYTKKGDFLALHAPDGRRLTPHQYKMGIRPCAATPALLEKIPAGRKPVAGTHREVNGRLTPFVLDDQGAEYEFDWLYKK
ncbi:MAG: WG repeat-containing protein [Saprospiraceae bacterium]|nr:WG repeat-containing protein [Saprospiraceae bacterium]